MVLPVLPTGEEGRKGVMDSGGSSNHKSSGNADISLTIGLSIETT